MTQAALSKQDIQRVRETIASKEGGSKAIFQHLLEIESSTAAAVGDESASLTTIVPVGNKVSGGKNEVGIEAFTKLLLELRSTLSSAQIRQLYTKIDENGNACISRDEFCQFVGDEEDVNKGVAKREAKKKQGKKKAGTGNVPDKSGGLQSNGSNNSSFSFPSFHLGTLVRFPSLRLGTLHPNLPNLPSNVQLPGFTLGEFPGIDLDALTLALESGGIDIPSIELPLIKLCDFPGLPKAIRLEIDKNLDLPSIRLGDFPGIALPTMGLTSFRLPSCKLGSIPDIVLPKAPTLSNAPDAPRFDIGGLNLPSFRLGDVPGLDLPSIYLQLQNGQLRLADLQLPKLKLDAFLLPQMSLALLELTVDLPALRICLASVELPSMTLSAVFPDLDFSVATKFLKIEAPKIPAIPAIGQCDLPTFALPAMQLRDFPNVNLGGGFEGNLLLGDIDLSNLNVQLPSISLGNIPNVVLPTVEINGAWDLPSVRLPALSLKNFPGIQLPSVPTVQLPSGALSFVVVVVVVVARIRFFVVLFCALSYFHVKELSKLSKFLN